MDEVDQLYKRNCFEPILVKDITTSQRRKACDSIMLPTENNNGDVKGRSVFNSKKSHVCTTKEETSSPTSVNESIIITASIYSKEGRYVMEVDVPNTFIQTKIPHKEKGERLIMKITGALVDMLLKLDTDKFKGCVVYENGKKVIYVVVLR